MARESGLWKWLETARLEAGRDSLDLMRVENGISGGTPDVEGTVTEGRSFWIELKSCSRPAGSSTPLRPKFKPQQAPWLQRRWKLGQSVWVLMQVGHGRSATRYLIPGRFADLVAHGVTEASLKWLSYALDRDGKTARLQLLRLVSSRPQLSNAMVSACLALREAKEQ